MVTETAGLAGDLASRPVNYEAEPLLMDGIALLPHSDVRLAREALNYEPRPGDVILATFPKSGTTWCQYLIWGIHNLKAVEEGLIPPVQDVLTKHFPYIDLIVKALSKWALPERKSCLRACCLSVCLSVRPRRTNPVGAVCSCAQLGTSSTVADRPPPRFIKTHMPAEVMHRSSHSGAKYVVCVRNPFDVATSYFHMRWGRRSLTGLPPDYGFDHFLEELLSGGIVGGNPFHHVRAWYDRSQGHDNVLLVYYEVLKKEPRKAVLELAKFLNTDAATRLAAEPSLVERLLEQTSIERLRDLTGGAENFAEGDFSRHHPTAALFRKGVVGDWRSIFNKDQERRFREAYDRALGDTEMHELWAEYVTPSSCPGEKP